MKCILTTILLFCLFKEAHTQDFFDLNITEQQFNNNKENGILYTRAVAQFNTPFFEWEDKVTLNYLYFDPVTGLSNIRVIYMKSVYTLQSYVNIINAMGIAITNNSWLVTRGKKNYSVELKNDTSNQYKWYMVMRPM